MFGKRTFEIYKAEKQHEYVTRRDFSDLFIKNLGDKKARVLFSFGYINQEVVVNMLIRYDNIEK